jgi:hypothetical protein
MKNYKTTFTGCALAILYALQPMMGTGTFDLKKDLPRYAIAILIAALGFLAKDNDVTGV